MTPSSFSRRPASVGGLRSARRSLPPRAISASTSIRSAAAARFAGRCQITVAEGEFAKHGIVSKAGNLSEFSKVEQRYDDKRGLKSGRRLSCQTCSRATS